MTDDLGFFDDEEGMAESFTWIYNGDKAISGRIVGSVSWSWVAVLLELLQTADTLLDDDVDDSGDDDDDDESIVYENKANKT